MTVWVVTGGLGSGKSLQAVAKIQAALLDGRRVATNMDLRLERMVSPRKARNVWRLPDHPTLSDLKAIGKGYEGRVFSEKKFGLIVLDEAAGFLNAREYQGSAGTTDKEERRREAAERMKLVLWLRHCRKYRWHLILVTQDAESLDAQVRRALCDTVVDCRRLDAWNVPLVSTVTKMIGLGPVKLPQVHLGVVKYKGVKADTWWLPDARWLHGAYETQQEIVGEVQEHWQLLDGLHAPYMWKPRGWREILYELGGWRLWGPSPARQRYDDFRLFEAGLTLCKQQHVPFADWDRARADAGAEGGTRLAAAA